MATSLVISIPDIPFNAAAYTLSSAHDPDHPVYNLITGPKYGIFQLQTGTTSANVVFDLASTYTSKRNQVDHVIVGRADTLRNAGCTTINLASSPDNSVWTTRFNDAALSSATLYGPKTYDYVSDFTQTSAFRYWRFKWDAGASCGFPCSKLYFGSWFDMGIEPNFKIDRAPVREGKQQTTSGMQNAKRLDEPAFRFDLTWEFVTDAIAQSFLRLIARYAHRHKFWLYTRTRHEVLDYNRLVYCECRDPKVEHMTRKNDLNRITATFVEVLG